MTEAKYHDLVEKHKDERVVLEVDFLQLGILLGSIKLMLKHPEVQQFSTSYHLYVEDLQRHILSKYAQIGVSVEDINAIADQYT